MQIFAEPDELFEMSSAELTEATATQRRQAEPHHPMVVAVGPASNEPGRLGAINQADCAVMSDEERFCDLADGGPGPMSGTANREQELMLHGAEPGRSGLFFTPVKEPSQADPELEEPFEVFVANMCRHKHIVAR